MNKIFVLLIVRMLTAQSLLSATPNLIQEKMGGDVSWGDVYEWLSALAKDGYLQGVMIVPPGYVKVEENAEAYILTNKANLFLLHLKS